MTIVHRHIILLLFILTETTVNHISEISSHGHCEGLKHHTSSISINISQMVGDNLQPHYNDDSECDTNSECDTDSECDSDSECHGDSDSECDSNDSNSESSCNSEFNEYDLASISHIDCEESDNLHDDIDIDSGMFESLYPGAICGAYCAIMELKSSYNLPFSTIDGILKLLQLLCPSNNKLPTSVYLLRKFFLQFQSHKTKLLYCSNCHQEVEEKCEKPECNESTEADVLIHLDITKQLKTILYRKCCCLSVYKNYYVNYFYIIIIVSHRLYLYSCIILGHWKDVQCFHSSSVLSESTALSHHPEFFSFSEHIGVALNTDGVSLFKSSKLSLWPVFLEIVNFGPSIRFRYDNVVICSVWIGRSKPNMHTLLKPILERLHQLDTLGFSFSSPEGVKTVRVRLLFGVFDLIAKSQVLNMKQFNGEYGCATCIHPGKHHGGSRVYLPRSYPLRTMASIKRAITEGTKIGKIIEGIKGVSSLYNYLHLVEAIPVDYMHCVLEGVTKSFLIAWTTSKFSGRPFSIRRHLHALDESLLKQTPPHEFTRAPRSVITELSHWKAS